MKRMVIMVLSLMLLTTSAAYAASKDSVNMETIGCMDFFKRVNTVNKSNSLTAALFSYWLYGYASGIHGNGLVDKGQYLDYNYRLAMYCKENPDMPILKAVGRVRFIKKR